jgi:hypothetical protein
MKLHQNDYLLKLLGRGQALWDYELVARIFGEYGVGGVYWANAVCLALSEMAAGGLIVPLENRIDDGTHLRAGRLMFKWKITDSGLRQVRDHGLPG